MEDVVPAYDGIPVEGGVVRKRKEKGKDRELISKEERRLKKERKSAIPQQPESIKSSALSTVVKVILLFALIPMVLSVPFFLSYAGDYIKDHTRYLWYVWGVYAVILVAVFFHFKKKTITLNSFTTQNLTYMIFTLGAYTLADIPRFLPFELRQVALYLWCSLTMIFNLLFFFMDDTDYQEQEKKEQRKEEKRKKKEEERKQKELEKKKPLIANPKLKLLVDIILYILYAILLGVAVWYGYYWFQDFQHQVIVKHMGDSGINSPEYESVSENNPPDE